VPTRTSLWRNDVLHLQQNHRDLTALLCTNDMLYQPVDKPSLDGKNGTNRWEPLVLGEIIVLGNRWIVAVIEGLATDYDDAETTMLDA